MLSKRRGQHTFSLKKLLSIFIVAASLVFSTETNASHLLGGDLVYEKNPQAPGQIRFRLTLYGDPTGITFSNTQQIRVIGAPTTYNATLLSNTMYYTTCSDSIRVLIYQSAYFTLPAPAAQGTNYYWSDCCRPPGITNLNDPSSRGLYLPVQIRSYSGTTSFFNSPRFLASSNFVVQANATSQVSFAADDPDGDSLYYSWASARELVGTTPTLVPYAQGFSDVAPFDSTTTTFLDPKSGLLTIVNPKVGNYTVVVRVESFSNGQLMGRVFREQNIKVIGQAVSSYTLSMQSGNFQPAIAHTKLDSTHFLTIYEGNALSFQVQGQAIYNAGIAAPVVTMGLQGVQNISSLNGGTCTSNNCIALTGNLQDTTQVTGVVSFTPPVGFIPTGSASRFVTFQVFTRVSDWCGGETQHYQTYVIQVKKSTIWSSNPNLSKCPNETLQAVIVGDTSNLLWSPSLGVSNINSARPFLSPPVTTTYTVTNLNDGTYTSIYVIIHPDSLYKATLLHVGEYIKQTLPASSPIASAWYYNGSLIEFGKNEFFATNGSYYTKNVFSPCDIVSDTFYMNLPKQSAIVAHPFDSIVNFGNVDSIEFVIEGTNRTNTIDEIFIVINKSSIPALWEYQIQDENTNQVVRSGLLDYDINKKRINIGTSLQLPFTPTSKYRVTLGWTFGLYDFTFYKKHNLPFVDSKGIFKITETTMKTLNNVIHTDMHVPLVIQFANDVIGVNEVKIENGLEVYPNPFTDVLRINSAAEQAMVITITDVCGRAVLQTEATGPVIIPVMQLPAGFYTYRIFIDDSMYTGKLQKL